jgi:hypothetical protein
MNAGEALERIAPLSEGERIMRSPPTVTAATYCEGHRVLVTFSDGLEGIVDFGPWLHGPVFEPLKDPTFFRRFYIDGGTIAWPNGGHRAGDSPCRGEGKQGRLTPRSSCPDRRVTSPSWRRPPEAWTISLP